MARALIAMLGLGIVAMVLVGGVHAGLETAGPTETVTNETFTPDAGNVTTLDESNRQGVYYSETVTVYNESSVKMQAGTDYEWNAGSGTIQTYAGGDLDGDASATITYQYTEPTENQQRMAGLLALLPEMLALVLPLLGFLMLLMVMTG